MVKRTLIALVVLTLLGWAGRYVYLELQEKAVCSICHRAMHEQTAFRIQLRDRSTKEVCCPRCGLHFMKERDDVAAAEAKDFHTGERLSARNAFYVEGSSVHPCCGDMAEMDRSGVRYDLAWDRCLPSLIAFNSREAAEAFRKQKGGVIKLYEELLLEGL